MCNSINIPELVLQDAEIGERVTVPVTGLVQEDEDGNRFLEVIALDGNEVEDFDEKPTSDMDSDDAITLFIGNLNKNKRRKEKEV